MIRFLFTACFLIIGFLSEAQTCNAPGQTPSTAFPVCGTSVFKQTTVPICSSHTLTVPGCSGSTGAVYADKNPFWYKFTCFQPGTLGFLISPANQGDDYDWQLYDITGRNPDDVFTDASLIVTGNWAGTFGNTGASASGVNFIQCASDPAQGKNSFSQMPNIVAGHTYLLLVSHFTDSQSGYDLSFGGGTAVITDTVPPALKKAESNCGGNLIRLKLSKKIKCSSLAINGSDFFITPGSATITGATGIGCSSGFDTDSIEFQLSSFLAPGNYTLNIKKGDDGNTLLDYCDNPVTATDKADFKVFPLSPTPMDSLVPVKCALQSLRLIFPKPILCSSVAANGSDFSITGTYPVTIASASANCNNSTTSRDVVVNFSQPLYQAGSFTLTLKAGTDGNTLTDECGQQTPAGSSLSFSVKDTVNADFSYEKFYGCTIDTVDFHHSGGNGVVNWKWNLDENKTSTLQNPRAFYQVFNSKKISLVVNNGFCSDTSSQTVVLDNFIKADFSTYEDNCPNEPVNFTSSAQGHVKQHHWTFGDGGSADKESPTHVYTQPSVTTPFIVNYTVTDSLGCQSTAQKTILVYSSCYLAVPNAFTPNNDGKNDFLKVLNAIKVEKLDFRIFNRWGQLVFQTTNWKQGWDGKINGVDQATGVYVWYLTYTDRESKQQRTMRGTATLIR
jgi:gliding motility-associated-like protein